MGKAKQQQRRKTVGRNGVSRSKVEKPRRTAEDKLGAKREFVNVRVLRKRAEKPPPPTLVAFEVRWQPHPGNAPGYVSLRLEPTATFSEPVAQDRITYAQYTRDQFSIAAGTDPGNLQFTTTHFTLDAYSVDNEAGDVATSGVLTFQDNPGYTPNYLLDATTDLHYTFGAHWRITLDGAVVLDTSAHPLFATASGAHPRAFVPPVVHTANYDLAQDNWTNAPPLATQWAAPPHPYPMPQVNDP